MPIRLVPPKPVEAERAWEPWRPDNGQRFNLRWAGHLYRRAAFGGTLDELRKAVKDGPDATIDRLLKGDADAAGFESLIATSGASIAQGDIANLRGWWLYVMLNGGHPLREKMTLFWHNNFATSFAKVQKTHAMYAQNQLLRKHALGSFKTMVAEISRDPAMLVWLDANRNVKGQANENYARELMELFTLGVGHYTEADVREAARAFTGWRTDGEQTEFSQRFHDEGPKTVLGQRGVWTSSDVQRIIFDQPAASTCLARKLYRYFISESAEPANELIEPLAKEIRARDFNVGPVVAIILRSRHFFSEHAYRKKIKSPVDYVLGVVRTVRPAVPPRELVQPLENMGQALFAPPNVKGWVGGKAWLNSATVLARQNFAETMLGIEPSNKKPAADVQPEVPADPVVAQPTTAPVATVYPINNAVLDLVKREKPATPAATVKLLAEVFLQGDLAGRERKKLVQFAKNEEPKDAAADQRVREIAHALMTMPEYTLN